MTKNTDRLKKYKQEFEKLSETAEKEILLKNKKLENVLTEQTELQLKWNRLYSKVYSLRKDCVIESEKAFGRAYTDAVTGAYKSVSSTDAKHAAMCDDNYIENKQFENKVIRLEKDVEGFVDVIESRKYILKDLARTIVETCNTHILS